MVGPTGRPLQRCPRNKSGVSWCCETPVHMLRGDARAAAWLVLGTASRPWPGIFTANPRGGGLCQQSPRKKRQKRLGATQRTRQTPSNAPVSSHRHTHTQPLCLQYTQSPAQVSHRRSHVASCYQSSRRSCCRRVMLFATVNYSSGPRSPAQTPPYRLCAPSACCVVLPRIRSPFYRCHPQGIGCDPRQSPWSRDPWRPPHAHTRRRHGC